MSLTMMRNVQVLESPSPSVTLKVMVVIPFGKTEPDAGPAVWTTALGGNGQLSEPAGVAKVAMPVHNVGVVPTAWLAGQVMVGACASVTVTVKEQAVLLLLGSVAFHATVVIPTGKPEPLAVPAGLVRVSVYEQLSEAVTV